MTETQLVIAERVEKADRLAFKIGDAATLISVCASTMHALIQRRKIYPTRTLRLITKEELLRYLREETDLARRSKNFKTAHQKLCRSSINPPSENLSTPTANA